MSLSLKQIRYFIVAAESGQFSQAASELHISQSAITTAIKGLENLMDTKLFYRQSHGVSLTYEGSQFLQHAKYITSALEEAIRIPNREKMAIEGTVNLALSYTVAGYFSPTYLARFNRSFPNVELKLIEGSRSEIEEGIIDGTFDAAMILTSNLVNQENISVETLIQSRRRLWLSPNHKFIRYPSVGLQDIAGEPYIMLTVDEASNTALRYWNQTPHRPKIIFRTSSVEAVRSMVANDMGVTILSDMVYRPWSLEGRKLEVKDIVESIPKMDVGLVWAKNRERTPPTEAFYEFMHMAIRSTHSSQ
ncbi:MAG: LysR family transcriptional regulator [Gammaproteobacteria bacterium]|nr:LysR family transcriptional regulator [Gammaproteobacteria bacterium]